jgi:hypothetical protein
MTYWYLISNQRDGLAFSKNKCILLTEIDLLITEVIKTQAGTVFRAINLIVPQVSKRSNPL